MSKTNTTRAHLVGITGGMGAGKSTVASYIAESYPVLSSDSIAKELLASDEAVIASVKDEFGDDIYREDGTLDRERLASVVFSDNEKLQTLNRIVHPRTSERIFETFERRVSEGHTLVFNESALLFEANVDDQYDYIIAIIADPDIIIERLTSEGRYSEADIRRRMANQLPMEEKSKHSDFTIANNGSKEELIQRTGIILNLLKAHIRTS